MLTEREWLENREYAKYHYSCQWCSQYDPMLIMPDRQNVPCMWYATCPCNTNNYDYKDALEFSERVTTMLAERCVLLEKVVQKALGAAEYINLSAAAENTLKAARMAVEEKMNG